MEWILYSVGGAILALAIDWATYTHLSAYLRVGIPNTPHYRYRDIAFAGPQSIVRTAVAGCTGIAAGVAFSFNSGSLWLLSVGLFAVAHALLYATLYRAR